MENQFRPIFGALFFFSLIQIKISPLVRQLFFASAKSDRSAFSYRLKIKTNETPTTQAAYGGPPNPPPQPAGVAGAGQHARTMLAPRRQMAAAIFADHRRASPRKLASPLRRAV